MCTFQTCTLFSARFLALPTSRLPSMLSFPPLLSIAQKNPRVRKIRVRNSGAGNGCANFMDAWKNASFLQEKPCP